MSDFLKVVYRRALASEDPALVQVFFDAAVIDRYRGDAAYQVIRTDTAGRVRKQRGWALDVGITTAKHDITLGGAAIGTTKILPINVIAQYHFAPGGNLRPYVGAGVNYTNFSDVNILGGAVSLDSSSFGPVVQAGLDWAFADKWMLNVDLKKVWISTDASGAASGGVDIDPLVYGIGVGYRF